MSAVAGENEIVHSSPQAAIDYALDRLLRKIGETEVHLRNVTATIKIGESRVVEKPPVVPLIGDKLRDEYLDLLRRAFTQGFITREEYSQRADTVLAARTRAELAPLAADLAEVEQEKPELPAPHRHESCVGLPVVAMLMMLGAFLGMIITVASIG